jgi:hypothetical protein
MLMQIILLLQKYSLKKMMCSKKVLNKPWSFNYEVSSTYAICGEHLGPNMVIGVGFSLLNCCD